MARGGSKPGERRGGRKKGVPNRKTQAVKEKLDQIGAEPLEGMARIAKWAEDNLMTADTLKERIDCMKLAGSMYSELAQYEAPKRKAIEGAPNGGNPVEMVLRWNE